MADRVVEQPRAQLDVVDHYLRIQSDQPDAADRFLQAVEDAYHGLVRLPLSGHAFESENPRLHGFRIGRITGFPNHLIFYRLTEEGVVIVRILHGARDLDAALDG